ncbi:hypothetical protein FSP39_024025 [Pinctada imbricata]|uniref:Reverse transcriptase zinc-binding domain-containing protein n=1 Tax=Pinctada imbricata TaxID=66713 RepID=A0AA88Y1J3_PINIB|nr:hypothetical protein FSP39_024025 [Pinctada imbricata]
MIDLNYKNKIVGIKRLLGSWMKRDLTPIGKITIIKSLALPKLIHLFSALPNPSKQIIKELEQIFYKFIWNQKPDKIKRKTLIGECKDGGLNMIHIPSFINYIKIKWVKRYFDNPNGNWQSFLSNILYINTDIDSVWFLNAPKLEEIKKCITNQFWKDVIFSVILSKKKELNISDLIQQDIRNICSLAEYTFYTRWKDFGINCLNDLIDNNGNFKAFEEIQKITKCNNFLKYYHLTNQINGEWKRKIRDFKKNQSLLEVCEDDVYLLKIISNKSIKFVYNDFRKREFCSPEARFQKWKNEIDLRDNETEDFSCYSIAKTCTKETKLIYFQYKLLNRILTTNVFLKKIGKREDDLCTFCKENSGTLNHLFFECHTVKEFWNDCRLFLTSNSVDISAFTSHNIIFGISSGSLLVPYRQRRRGLLVSSRSVCLSVRLSVRLSHFQFSGLFSAVVAYIELIFGMWIYLNVIQIKCEFAFD